MNHIVFSGQLANGKDQCADIVAAALNATEGQPTWRRSAFAGAVKDIYAHAFGVDRDFIEKHKRLTDPPPGFIQTVRKALQFIGDGFRQIRADVWIELALRDPSPVIISDGRYINEARAAKKRGGTNVVVWRPGFENDDPNRSESEILVIVKWCLETNQNGPIVVRGENVPDAIREGVYDYFFRNDVALDELPGKVNRELIPFLLNRYDGR